VHSLYATPVLQENAYISEWEKLLGGVLKPAGYERLAYHSLRAIHLVLFAGRRFRRQVLSIHGSAVATGIGNVVGNKVGASCGAARGVSNSAWRAVWQVSHACELQTLRLGPPIQLDGCLMGTCWDGRWEQQTLEYMHQHTPAAAYPAGQFCTRRFACH
jgi:hypothetical protein